VNAQKVDKWVGIGYFDPVSTLKRRIKMVDFNSIAIADILRHPVHGLVSHQPAMDTPVEDRIWVRDIQFRLFQVLASECEYPTMEEIHTYWKTVNELRRD
jgi:hypothetical protein